jgi:hypothetical protein
MNANATGQAMPTGPGIMIEAGMAVEVRSAVPAPCPKVAFPHRALHAEYQVLITIEKTLHSQFNSLFVPQL